MLIEESIENVLSPIVRRASRYSTQKSLYKYERQIEAEIANSKLECGYIMNGSWKNCRIRFYTLSQAIIYLQIRPSWSEKAVLDLRISVDNFGKRISITGARLSIRDKKRYTHLEGDLDSYNGNVDLVDYRGPEAILTAWNNYYQNDFVIEPKACAV